MTMFVAASQYKVNGVYKQSVLSKVSGFEIPNTFFGIKCLLLSRGKFHQTVRTACEKNNFERVTKMFERVRKHFERVKFRTAGEKF